jgi:hypothetical protein
MTKPTKKKNLFNVDSRKINYSYQGLSRHFFVYACFGIMPQARRGCNLSHAS